MNISHEHVFYNYPEEIEHYHYAMPDNDFFGVGFDERQFGQGFPPMGGPMGMPPGAAGFPGFQPPFPPQYGPPFGPPGQGPQYGPPYGPPGQGPQYGPPYGPAGQGQQAGPPTAPPPSFVPAQTQQASAFAVDPGSIRGCLFRFTYVWLRNRQQFWFYPTFVGRRSVSGYRWNGFRWLYFGIDLREIQSFTCI